MRASSAGIIGVSAGVLDDSSWFKANTIVYNKRKSQWDFIDTSISNCEEMPPVPVQK